MSNSNKNNTKGTSKPVDPTKDQPKNDTPNADKDQPDTEAPTTDPTKDQPKNDTPNADKEQPDNEAPTTDPTKDQPKKDTPNADKEQPDNEAPNTDPIAKDQPKTNKTEKDQALKIMQQHNVEVVYKVGDYWFTKKDFAESHSAAIKAKIQTFEK